MELFNSIPFVDAHCDTILEITRKHTSLSGPDNKTHLNIEKMQSGAVKIQFFAAFVEPDREPASALKRSLLLINKFQKEMEANSGSIENIKSSDDLKRVLEGDKMGSLLTIEGGEVLENDLELLELFYRLGVRSITLTWNYRNAIGDGAAELTYNGLSRFGLEVVKKMNELGMLIDVSHLNEAGFWDVMRNSTKPVIASHSNARMLCDHPRNLTDEQILAIADNGGVMCVNFVSPFLVREKQGFLEDVVAHIDHISKIAGTDHVGIGSDFDGTSELAVGLEDATKVPMLASALASHGYSEENIEKILGGNLLRSLNEALE